jgi:hypothetical protein
MAFTFMKLASSTSSWLSFKANSPFVMAVACSVPPIEVLIVQEHFSKVSFVSPNPSIADAPSIKGCAPESNNTRRGTNTFPLGPISWKIPWELSTTTTPGVMDDLSIVGLASMVFIRAAAENNPYTVSS